MSAATEQRLIKLRQLVEQLDAAAASLRLEACEHPTGHLPQRVEIAERRSAAEKEIAALTVGQMRTA